MAPAVTTTDAIEGPRERPFFIAALPITRMNPAALETGASPPHAALLRVADLRVAIARAEDEIRPVDGVEFSIDAGETFALLGESGCGKSMTALALARLLPDAGRVVGGSVTLGGDDLLALPESAMRRVRGGRIGMIFQEPSTSLNPVMTVGAQIAEALAHHGVRGDAARDEAARLLEAVGIPDAARRLQDYPFQFSGGMKQRVMIAIAMACNPRILIADEPTTALDVTIQAQIIALMKKLQREHGTSIMMITHNMASALELGNRTIMMDRGHIIHDAAGEKRDGLTVEKLLQEFKNASGAALDNDRMLLT